MNAVCAFLCRTFPALMIIGLAAAAHAQTVTGTLQGSVTDTSLAVLPGVTVTIRNTETAQVREIVTNESGFYSAPFLPLGRYTVTASLAGFRPVRRTEVEVTLNQTTVANFTLDPAASEEVVVVGAAPPINTVNAEIKGSLTEQQILDKPTLNPGSFLSLAEIFTGFQENPTSGQNNPTASSGSSINFNGTGTRGATFQIDGVNNDDSSENQHRQGAALSTIKEFQVITNSFSAEFGRGYGAVVLVQTKSGTNDVHGDVYEFRQDSDFNAKRNFALTKPVSSRDEYGGTIGFPVRRNHLFGFASFDKTASRGDQNYARDLFTPEELAAPRLTRGNDTPENRAFIESLLKRYPASAQPNDPRSNRTYATVLKFDFPDEDHSGRLDWQGKADQIYGRYQFTRQRRTPQDVIIGEQANQNNRQQNLGITWTKVFSSSMVGEFRYGLGVRNTRVDVAAGNDTPIIRFRQSPVATSSVGSSGQFPIHRDQTDHQFVYNLSKMFGRRHTFKSGADLRFQALDDIADDSSRGTWTFDRTCGGTVYATSYLAFLDGCVMSFRKSWGPFFLENRLREYNFYAEDTWRVRPNLTLDLGVRYEYVAAPSDVDHRIDYGFRDDKDNVEPRLGAAYTPEWHGRWQWLSGKRRGDASFRGGYGVVHGRLFQSVFSQNGASLRSNPPNALSRTITTQPGILNISDPTLGFVFVPGPQTARHTIVIASPDLEMPSTHQWNATYERKLPFASTLRVTYSGTRGKGFVRYAPDNLPVTPAQGGIVVVDHPNNAPAAGFPDLRGKRIDRIAADILCAGTGLPGIGTTATCPDIVPIADNEISVRVPRTNERRPDPRYGTNLLVSNGAETWYDGLQMEWIKRFSAGLHLQVAYTLSKATDTTSEATFVGAGDSNQLGPNAQYARGFSRFHTPHRLTINGSYLLPFLRDRGGAAGLVFGGWQVSGVVRLASGTPFTVTQPSVDLNFDGFSEARPVILDRSILGRSVDDPDRSTQQLPASAFRRAGIGDEFASLVGRNTFFGDGLNVVDFGLFKTWRMPARGQLLSLRAELYNALNIVQYGFPTTDITSTNFGRILGNHSRYDPRIVQVAVRYRF